MELLNPKSQLETAMKEGKVKFITGDSNVEVFDQVVVADIGASGVTATLPPVAQAAGNTYNFILKSTGGGSLTIQDKGDAPAFSATLSAAGDSAVVKSNGLSWDLLT